MRSSTLRSAVHAALLVLAIAGIAGCADDPAAAPPAAAAARSVRVAPVRAAPLAAEVRAVGVLGPKDELALGFKIGGVVARIDVDEGDTVEAGQLLAALDPAEVDAAVARAREAARQTERDLARTRALYADDVATLEQVEHAQTAVDIARASLDAARFDARHARIEAPSAGLVQRRLAEPAELVAAGAPVLVVGSLAGGWAVRAGVADRDVVRLAVGDAARATFDALPGEVFAARIARIATASDPRTGTYEIELTIEPAGAAFVQGLIAKLVIDAARDTRPRLWIPVEALLEANGAWADVAVIAGATPPLGTIQRRRVRIGALAGSEIEVREGLADGEQVVTEGAAWIEDGERVVVLAPND